MSTWLKSFAKTRWFTLIVGIVFGSIAILGIRFFTYKPVDVHYHANFALYINGVREEFKSARYYSAVEMCVSNAVMTPPERAHMHDNINNVVHVEDHAVTWGQFLTNLGWTMGPTFIGSPEGRLFVESGVDKLNLILNSQDYTDFGGLQNTVIKDKDKLLISFGNDNATSVMQQYNTIPSTAQKYDVMKDPASCSGDHAITTHDRIMHLF